MYFTSKEQTAMKVHIQYLILPKYQLIIETYQGSVTLANYVEMKTKQFADANFNKDFDIIADLRNANFSFDEPMTDLLDFFSTNKNNIGNRRSALIAQTPKETSKAIIFSNLIQKFATVNANVFSTLEAAYSWLGRYNSELLTIYK
ncbi:MAG: hypothetical protein JW717_05730 [Marinilabiliaceae bacterium]|nr:hypothetical protein [Marinilabiliaceae bacterium]